jgi:hypothetical protein
MRTLLRLLLYIGIFYAVLRVAGRVFRRAASGRVEQPGSGPNPRALDRSKIEDAEWEDVGEEGSDR